MPPPLFQVIAQITTDDFDLLDRVEKGLSRTFSLDLAPYRSELRSAGVCVARVSTLPEAEEKAQLARGIGADYRIVDPQNRTVRQGFGRRGEAPPPPGRRREDPPTLLGGFNAPAGTPTGRAPSGLHARVQRAPSREDPALARTLAGIPGSGTGGDGPTAEFVRPGPSGELEPLAESRPVPAPPPPASGFNLDALDADDLVLLDGSREEPQRPSPSGLMQQPSAAEMMAFAPPSADEDLELEESARPAPPVPPPPARPRAASQPIDLLPPDPEPVDDLPEVSALAEAALVLDQPSPPSPRAPAPTAAQPKRPTEAQRSARRAPATPIARAFAGRLLFGGWFRERPRLRILVGFVLALGLGSIVPACHARSVLSSRVTPQLEDLSTAKAHGHILSHLPNYRSPAEIEAEISSIKTRGKVLSFALWLLLGGGLGFAWFRFT